MKWFQNGFKILFLDFWKQIDWLLLSKFKIEYVKGQISLYQILDALLVMEPVAGLVIALFKRKAAGGRLSLASISNIRCLLTIYKIPLYKIIGKRKSLECTWFLGFSILLVGYYVIHYILFCEYVQTTNMYCIVIQLNPPLDRKLGLFLNSNFLRRSYVNE